MFAVSPWGNIFQPNYVLLVWISWAKWDWYVRKYIFVNLLIVLNDNIYEETQTWKCIHNEKHWYMCIDEIKRNKALSLFVFLICTKYSSLLATFTHFKHAKIFLREKSRSHITSDNWSCYMMLLFRVDSKNQIVRFYFGNSISFCQ